VNVTLQNHREVNEHTAVHSFVFKMDYLCTCYKNYIKASDFIDFPSFICTVGVKFTRWCNKLVIYSGHASKLADGTVVVVWPGYENAAFSLSD
jgi:hypothetical protein